MLQKHTTSKECRICGQILPLSFFSTWKYKDIIGWRHQCRACLLNRRAMKELFSPELRKKRLKNLKEYCKNRTFSDKDKKRIQAYYKVYSPQYNMRPHVVARRKAIGYSESKKAYQKEYIKRPNVKIKLRARKAVWYALRSGKLVKPLRCSKCSSNTKIEAHHTCYSKPLKVTWLCAKCHKAIHYAP